MNKVYLKVELSVVVDTDLTSPDDIMEHLDIDVLGDVEGANVLQSEVDKFYITDAK